MPNFSCVAERRRLCVSAALILSRRNISGLAVEYIVAIDMAGARFPAGEFSCCCASLPHNYCFGYCDVREL